MILFQLQTTHLNCLSVGHLTINWYLSHRLSSCWSAVTCNVTTTVTTTANTVAAAWGGRSSGSRGRSTSANSYGAGGAAGCGGSGGGGAAGCGNCPSAANGGGRGPRVTLHGALCSSHLWPPAPLNGSPVPGRQKKGKCMRGKKASSHNNSLEQKLWKIVKNCKKYTDFWSKNYQNMAGISSV